MKPVVVGHITSEQQSLRGSCLCLRVGLDRQQPDGSEPLMCGVQRGVVLLSGFLLNVLQEHKQVPRLQTCTFPSRCSNILHA